MTLLEAFEKKILTNEKPEKVIETVFSKLFFFKDKVIKIYKYNDSYYGDFSNPTFRKSFYRDDFSWNNIMAPEIYLELKGFKNDSGKWISVDYSNAEDFYIEMKRIDDTSNLTHLLITNTVTDQNLRDIGSVTVEKLKTLTLQNKDALLAIFESGGKKIIHDALLAVEEISKAFAPKTIDTDFITSTVQALTKHFENSDYFKNFDDARLEVSIDNHSDNILIINNTVEFIDVLLPREHMRVSDPLLNLAKTSGCVAALASPEKADLIYETYIQQGGLYDKTTRNFYEVFICFLLTLYNDGLGRVELSERYAKFVSSSISSL
jgi:aminoglycoside phosphotransferase family enzyme